MMTKTRSKKRRKVSKFQKPQQEQRVTERVKLIAAATLYTELTPRPGDGHKVWVTNISLGGVAFKTSRVYEVGTRYHLRLDAGPIDMSAPIRIVWFRRKADGIFEVGSEFVPD